MESMFLRGVRILPERLQNVNESNPEDRPKFGKDTRAAKVKDMNDLMGMSHEEVTSRRIQSSVDCKTAL